MQPKKIGLADTFTSHYPSVRIMVSFLEKMGHQVIKSPRTTPEILEAATTFSSADLCISLRLYVGHSHYLLKNHPDLDFFLAPNVCREDNISSTCAKYRDIGGVALRSLGSAVAYARQTSTGRERVRLAGEEAERIVKNWPCLLQPNVWSTEYTPMRNLCFRLGCDVEGLGGSNGKLVLGSFLPGTLKERFHPFYKRMEEAFGQAYSEHMTEDSSRYERFCQTGNKPRLAIVGRQYLLRDALVTANLVNYFKRSDISVITPYDTPFSLLADGYRSVTGYYDTHRLFKAFVDFIAPQVDGFVLINSFGCHPDAFIMEILLEEISSRGIPAWLFKYDEQSGSTGFHTRYETVRGFLEKSFQNRQNSRPASPDLPDQKQVINKTPSPQVYRRPVIIWPYMNEIVNLMVEEVFYQAGLDSYLVPPLPTTEYTLEIGDDHHREACCPFALTTGSLRETLVRCLDEIDRKNTGPCRIIFLQGRQEGPCAYGWYSLAQAREVPLPYLERLAKGNHTVEMFSMTPNDTNDFILQLADLGDGAKLRRIKEYILNRGDWTGLKLIQERSRFVSAIKALTRTVTMKMNYAEKLRSRALILRAHEFRHGDTTTAYQKGIDLLRSEHTPASIRQAYRKALSLLEQVNTDDMPKPRVVIVGEIYVALSSFANRGTVENLLGRAGIEVEEGVALSKFFHHTLKEAYRRMRIHLPVLHQFLVYLARHNLYPSWQEIREKKARPFMRYEVGGDGVVSLAEARQALERGIDGIVHVYPFKCMPEGVAKDALNELAGFFGVRHISLTFGKEVEIERLKTEINTFAALLYDQMQNQLSGKTLSQVRKEQALRCRRLGSVLDALYAGMRKYSTDEMGYTGFEY